MKIELEAVDILDKVVKSHSGGIIGRIYVPKRLIGKKVKIIVLKDED